MSNTTSPDQFAAGLPQPPAAIIFDMDGLMIDTEIIYHRAWQDAAAELGYTIPGDLFHSLIGMRTDDCEARILEAMGPDFPLAHFHNTWPLHWDRIARQDGIALKPGLLPLLDLVDSHGLPKAVATSSTQEEAVRSLGLTGLATRFSVVVTGDQVPRGKPAPDIYLEAARRLAVAPDACVAFEDSSAGTLAAAAAGMAAFIVPDLNEPTAEARRAAAGVLDSLEQAPILLDRLLAPTE